LTVQGIEKNLRDLEIIKSEEVLYENGQSHNNPISMQKNEPGQIEHGPESSGA